MACDQQTCSELLEERDYHETQAAYHTDLSSYHSDVAEFHYGQASAAQTAWEICECGLGLAAPDAGPADVQLMEHQKARRQRMLLVFCQTERRRFEMVEKWLKGMA